MKKKLGEVEVPYRKQALIHLLEESDSVNPLLRYMLESEVASVRKKAQDHLADWVEDVLSSAKKIGKNKSMLLALLERGIFPLVTSDIQPMINKERRGKISKCIEIRQAIETHFPKSLLERCKRALCWFRTVRVSKESLDCFTIKDHLEKLTVFYQDPELILGSRCFQPFLKGIRELIDDLEQEVLIRERKVASWLEDYDVRAADLSVKSSLDEIVYLLRKERWDVLGQVGKQAFSPEHCVDNGMTGFLLDKVIAVPEFQELAWSLRYQETLRFQNSLDLYIKNISKDPFIPVEKRDRVQQALAGISKALLLMAISPRCSSGAPEPMESAAIAFQAYLKGESPVVISTGFDAHIAAIALYTGENSTKAILFNTGSGIKANHPRGKDPSKIQTYVGISDIPNSEITLDLLEKFGQLVKDKEELDPLYELFDSLKKKGKAIPPSKETYDYEMAQLLGSCSAQTNMAFFRYHFLNGLEGDILERMGLYKTVKAQILKILAEENLPYVNNENVQRESDRRLQEMSLQGAMWKISEKFEKWQEAMVILEKRRQELGAPSLFDKDWAAVSADSLSPSARRFLLEKTARLLSEHQNGIDNLHIEGLTPFMDGLVEKKKRRNDYISAQLNADRRKKDLKMLRNNLFRFTLAKGQVVTWLEEDFRLEPDFWRDLRFSDMGEALYKEAKGIAPHLFST